MFFEYFVLRLPENRVFLQFLEENTSNCLNIPGFSIFLLMVFSTTNNKSGYHKIVVTGLEFPKCNN